MIKSVLGSVGIFSPEDRHDRFLENEIKRKFPSELHSKDGTISVFTSIYNVKSLSDERLNMCLNTLDHTLGETYSLLHGKNWRSRKFEEMKEPGLIYILLKEKSDSKDEILAGFLSMKFVDEEGLWVVYLYEIQIEEGYRNCGIGSQLLDIYSSIPDSLNENGSYTNRFGPVDGTALTVFSSNEGAFRFYKAHGYKLDRNSPRDRKLRDGKIRKPAYYIMIKYSAAGSIR